MPAGAAGEPGACCAWQVPRSFRVNPDAVLSTLATLRSGLGPWAMDPASLPVWQALAFWIAASLVLYGTNRLAVYVSLSVDDASRRVSESLASVGIGALSWGLDMAACFLRSDVDPQEWSLLPALSSLIVMVVTCRIAVPVLLTRDNRWCLGGASIGMAFGVAFAHTILMTGHFFQPAIIQAVPFVLACLVVAALVFRVARRYQRARVRSRSSTPWRFWGACGAVVVLIEWLFFQAFAHPPPSGERSQAGLQGAEVMLVVGLFSGLMFIEQMVNMRSDRGRQHLFHRGLSLIRSGAETGGAQSDARLSLIADHLRELVVPERLELHFQPIANLRAQSVHLEALLRLEHPLLGRINPEQFFLACELRGWTPQADRLILRNALDLLRTWRAQCLDVPVNVNVAPETLMVPGFAEWLGQEIASRGLVPEDVRLELTEHAITACGGPLRRSVDELHAAGVQVVMDDFGVGYSSLGVLADLKLAGLKCDRLLLRDVALDPRRQALLRNVAAMGRDLGLPVTVEGIETAAELRCAVQCGIDSIQGYLFARPVPAADVMRWLHESRAERMRALVRLLAAADGTEEPAAWGPQKSVGATPVLIEGDDPSRGWSAKPAA